MRIKNLVLIFTLLVSNVWLMAQITVTNAVFPVAGDSIKTASDFTPDGISVTAPGGPFTWDYTNLSPDTRQVSVFQPAANGSAAGSFPGADLVAISDFGGETYFDVSATAFSIFGVSGADLGGGFPFETDFVFSPPLADLHAPLTFPNVFNGQTAFGFALSTDAIPSEILDSLGVPSGLLDSIRLRITIIRNDFVDAYGMVSIPGGTYDVLRQKRTDITKTNLEIHTLIFGWQDVTDLVSLEGFGTDTLVTYQFISNSAKGPIASLTMDSTGMNVQSVDYRDNGVPSAVDPVTGDKTEVVVSPNPAINEVTIELKNMTPGKHTLRLFDMNGALVIDKEMNASRETLSVKSLIGGVYLFQVLDRNDRIVNRGKILKINP